MDSTPYYEAVLEKNISSLIASQWPEWYREYGPILVEFVRQYYIWLEGSQTISNTAFVGKGYVTVNAQNPVIVGSDGTDFTTFFANGDPIAIYKQDSIQDYDLLTVNNVVNSSYLTVTSDALPEFSSSNSWYTTAFLQYNANYYLRRYLENKDIDLTADSFLVYFKEKYLKNIQFDTATNIKTLLKHSLDIYRSKGTERAIDLLFRAVFALPASVYYPGDDIFRLSDGNWYQPTYLEISIKPQAIMLVGRQVVGATSGALGFAEALVRRTIKGRLIDVLYISAVKGNFLVDEKINSADNILAPAEAPVIVGSLTAAVVDIEGTGANYLVGDVVDIYSDYGEQAKGIVKGISNTTGQIIFNLVNGGYGYQASSEVLVSSEIVTVSSLVLPPTNNGDNYVYMFDTMVQPLTNVTYTAITSNLSVGDAIYAYTNNIITGQGRVIETTPNSATTGTLLISLLSGSLTGAASLYTTANAKTITTGVFTNATCTANVIGYYANTTFNFINKTGSFILGEEVYQTDQYGLELANGSLSAVTTTIGSAGEIKVSNTYGVFGVNNLIRGRTSNASANLQTITIFVGVISVSNTFYTLPNNYVYFANSGSNGTITNISTGALANVTFSNSLLYTETVFLPTDYIETYLGVGISDTQYNFPGYPTGNLTSGTLEQMFANQSFTVGKVQQLTGINKGSNYNLAPIVRIYDPIISARYKKDMILNATNFSGVFKDGEIVTQASANSRGIVKMANTTQIWVEQLRVDESENFVPTTNSTTLLVGAESTATANIVSVMVDERSNYLGFNAQIDTQVKASPGAITNVQIIASGFGYQQSDSLRFVPTGASFDDPDAGFGFGTLINQGQSEGYYKRKGGWLSDQSRLYDGLYYQDFSYEIRASIALDKYEEMLRQILHVSGTKYFGALVYRAYVAATADVGSALITQS